MAVQFPASASSTVLQFEDTGGNIRTLTCDFNDVTYGRTRDVARTQTFCAIRKSPQPIDTSLQVAGLWNGTSATELDAIFDALLRSTVKKGYKYGPGGSATGDPMYSGAAFLTDYEVRASAGGNVEASATFEADGDDIRSTW